MDKERFCQDAPHDKRHDEGGICDPHFYVLIARNIDINADGLTDTVFITNNSTCGTCERVSEVFARLATAPFPRPDEEPVSPTAPLQADWALDVADGTKGLAVADFDGDGTPDLAVGGYHGNATTVLLGRPPCRDLPIYLRGDASFDGILTVSDAVMILRYLFTADEMRCPAALDTDSSGSVEISDAIRVLGYLFLGSAPPTPPFPFYGARRDGDPLPCETGE